MIEDTDAGELDRLGPRLLNLRREDSSWKLVVPEAAVERYGAVPGGSGSRASSRRASFAPFMCGSTSMFSLFVNTQGAAIV